MKRSDAARGYAKALFDLARLADSVDATDESLAAVASALRGNVDLRSALTDTGMPVEKKRAILCDIFGGSVTPEALGVVTVLVERGMTDSVGDVARLFREVAEAERGIVVAEVTTAVPLDEKMRASVTARLSEMLGRPVTLRERVDETMLGGIVIEVAGRVLDGSVSSQLEGVRKALVTAQGSEA